VSSEGELDGGAFGGLSGVVREGEVDGLGAGGASGGILHGIEGFGEGGVAEVCLPIMTVYTVEKGCDFKELETRIHEVEVLNILLRGHGGNLG